MDFLKNLIAGLKVLAILMVLIQPTLLIAQTGYEYLTEDELFKELQSATEFESERIEQLIIDRWSNSSSERLNGMLSFAKVTASSGNLDYAIQILNSIIEESPEFAEAWNVRATVHFIKGDFNSSVGDIAGTLRLNPRHFAALNGLALILEAIGDLEGALEAYRAVERLAPMRMGVRGAIERLEASVDSGELKSRS